MVTARPPHGYEGLPVPSYEEAISSRPGSSQSRQYSEGHRGDEERGRLLAGDGSGAHNASAVGSESAGFPPTAQDEADYFLRSSGESTRSADEGLRREVEQMEVVDPSDDATHGPSRMRHNLSKRLNSFTHSLSSIHLPFSFSFSFRPPSFASIRSLINDNTSHAVAIFARICALFLIALLVFFFATGLTRVGLGSGGRYEPESVREYVERLADATRCQSYLERVTAFDHIAGTRGDFAMAEYVLSLFAEAKLDHVEMNQYFTYLNYPRPDGRRVAIVEPPELSWEASLEELPVPDDSGLSPKQTLVFHGHSRSGNVTGPLIYANYGSREDFKALTDMGVKLEGSVVLVRYYGSQGDRALKVKAAELAGAVGCIIYSDPNEDGFIKGIPSPEGRWMPMDGVQRGAVSLMSWVVGDVLTPGYASTKDAPRISKDDNKGLVNIPSIPLAWRDAQRLLQVIKGHGKTVPQGWTGGVPEVHEWWTGDSSSPMVNLMNLQDEEEKQPIWNVLGSIKGEEQSEKTVIVGNHRDAWCFGGADPGSGTAVLLEVVAIFAELVQAGWRPRRTIQFASWDGEEYNLIGSTEWVEDNIDGLRRNGVAYLNVDTAVSGKKFAASASPLFQDVLLRILDRVQDPATNKTLRSLWDASQSRIEGLGAGSDYVAFQDLAGTSSIDFRFDGPGFPYHSCYDNIVWMKKYGDPDFAYHKTMAIIWSLLILEVADAPVLPFDLVAYSAAVLGYVEDIEKTIRVKAGLNSDHQDRLDLKALRVAANSFIEDAEQFQSWEAEWADSVEQNGGIESAVLAIHRMDHNNRLSNFETHLLDLEKGGGIPGREQFKHVIFGPQAWSGYDEAYFPGIRDAVDESDWKRAQEQIDKAARILDQASHKLLH